MLRLIIKFIVIAIMSVAGVLPATSQTMILRGLTSKEGLSGTIIYAIHKDKRGMMWFASDKGVDRFDGYHVYPCHGTGGAAVRCLAESVDGTVFAGNEAGLWRYAAADNTFKPVFRKEVNAGVSCLQVGQNEQLFAGTSKGVFIYADKHWRQILLEKNDLSRKNNILGLVSDKSGYLYVAGENGIYRIDIRTRKVVELLSGDTRFFTSIACDESYIYIGTRNKGLIRYDLHTNRFASFSALGNNSVKTIRVAAGGDKLYVATDGGGVYIVSTADGYILEQMESKVGVENTLRSNSVYSLLDDRDGILWIGYFQMGLDYTLYQNRLFSLYSFQPLFTSYHLPVRAIAVHGRQRVVGSRDGLYFIDEEKRIVKHYTMPQLASNMIFCVLYLHGDYLVGTAAGLYRLNSATGALTYLEPAGTKGKDEIFFSLAAARDGSLWVGTTTGVFHLDKALRTTGHYQVSNSQMPGNIVYNVYEDKERRAWISTDHGICVFEPSTRSVHIDLFPKAFPWKSIRNVYEGSNGGFYFTTTKGTILKASSDLKRTVAFESELFADGRKCMFLIEDDRQGLWMGTDNGLFCREKSGKVHTYTFRDGITDPVFFSCIPVRDENGCIWFGNSQGLLRWQRSYQAPALPYKIGVTDVLVNNRSLDRAAFDKEDIKLSSSQDELTFRISDFSYTDPASIAYEYCLENRDSRWLPLKGRSEITYYNLSSGFYTLKIRMAGVPSSEVRIPVSVGFSWWLIVLAVLVSAFVIGRVAWFRFGNTLKNRFLVRKAGIELEKTVRGNLEKYRNNKVEDATCVVLRERLETLMREQQPYLNPDLKLKDIAGRLGVPVYNLSYVLNVFMHQRFNDYINNYRIEAFKSLVKEEKYRRYTLDALSNLCGFSSKTSFFRNFKRMENITPSEYIKRLE